MVKSLLSGGIGIPEGGGKLLSRPEESAVQNLITNEISILNIVEDEPDGGGGGGGETDVWARFRADATKITGSTAFVLTASRTGEGNYAVTSTKTAGSSGGHFLYGVLVSVSAVSGDGGDGLSPFNEFDSYEVVDTDDTSNLSWFWNESNDKIYGVGPAADDVWVHLTGANFTTAATQVDVGEPVRATVFQAGVLNTTGEYVWVSGDAGGTQPIRVMKVSDNSVVDFGTNLDAVILAADATHIYVLNASVLKRYTPNIAGASLGSSDASWAFDPGVSLGMWDSEGYLWFSVGNAGLYQVDPSGSDFSLHAFPDILEEVSATSAASFPVYDRNRRKIYLTLNASSSQHYLYEFRGWQTLVDDTGTFERIAILPDGSTGLAYDPISDVMLTMNTGLLTVTRWIGDPKRPLDVVSVDDQTAPDNPEVDYDLAGTWFAYYDGVGNYAYVEGAKGTDRYLVKISYNGDPLDFGSGGGAVSSVLVPLYEVVSATVANVYLFRSLSPPIFADGEFTVEFKYPS